MASFSSRGLAPALLILRRSAMRAQVPEAAAWRTLRRRAPAWRALASGALLALTPAVVGAGEAVSPSPQRQHELVRMVRHDCGSCHGMTLQGGLGPALTREALVQRPQEYLESMILRGRAGTAMPAWQGLLDADDAQWIARQLKNGFPDER